MAEYTIDKIEYDGNVYKLQDNVSGYVSGGNVIPYLTCGTAAGTAAKTTTLVTGTLPATLTTGTRVAVKFTKSNTVANPTIAIGSYGAIAIKRYGTTAPSTTAATSWSEGNVITLVYDGTNWLMSDWTLSSASHTHGNITSGGDITATAPTIANGDQIVINDNSASKITNGPTFDGSTTTTALTPKGTWETFSKFSGSYNDLTNKPTIPTLPSNIVNTITTTEGAHTTITSQKNDVSFKVPTKTSHLTNDSGFITSYTDEKLKWTASTSTNTYYPLVSTSTATTSTANTLNGISFYQYYNTAGGYRRLELGNTTANQSTGGAYGAIRLFGANATYYGDLVPGNPELGSSISGAGLSANRTWKLPDKSGTIALTSDVIPKPPDDGAYGWVLKYLNTNSAFWDVPSGYRFTIREDENNPGTYAFEGDEPVNIQNALFSGTSLILELDLLNADIYDIYTLTDYYTQEISTNDGCYYVLWFTGIFRKTGTSHKKITVGIYLDELEVEHEYGEIAVTIDAVASAGTDGSEGMTIGDWKICWGSVSLNTASASGSGTYASPYYVSSSTISLNYTALPYIWCQVLGEWTGTRYATPYDTSETGFKIRLYASAKNSTSTSIRWLAIGKA